MTSSEMCYTCHDPQHSIFQNDSERKFCQQSSGPELAVVMILSADWRCWHFQNKRQNGTV